MLPDVPPPPVPVIRPAPTPVKVAATPPPPPSKLNYVVNIILLIGIVSAVILVLSRQFFYARAWDCDAYNFHVSPSGSVTVYNGTSANQPAQKASVSVNSSPQGILDVSSLHAGETKVVGDVTVPTSGNFTWDVVGSVACAGHSYYTTAAIPAPY